MTLIYINGRLIPAQLIKRTVENAEENTVEITFDTYGLNNLVISPGGVEFVDVVDISRQSRHVFRRQPRLQIRAGSLDYQYSNSELRVTCINEINL